jgi:replicative DNA helicase
MTSDLVNIEAERAVLSGILGDPDNIAKVVDWLPVDAFGDGQCRAVYLAMTRLWERRVPATVATVPDALKIRPDQRDRMTVFLADLSIRAGWRDAQQVTYHGDLILELARRRAGERAAAELVADIHKGEPDWEEAAAAIRRSVEPFRRPEDGPVIHADRVDVFTERLQQRWCGELHERVVPTGVRMLDGMLAGGMRGGDLVILAARTSMGKTATMLHVAKRSRSLVFSLEMTEEAILNRLACTEAGVPYDVGMTTIGIQEHRNRLLDATDRVRRMPLTVLDKPWTTARIEAEIERRRLDGEVDAVFIDHISKLSDEFRRASEYERISALSARCKNMALRHDVPVIVLSQLNREVEHRRGCMPFLSDLRESGKLEEDADAVLLLWRRAYYVEKGMADADEEKDRITGTAWDRLTVNVAKNRNGITGIVDMGFDRNTMRLHEVSERMAA